MLKTVDCCLLKRILSVAVCNFVQLSDSAWKNAIVIMGLCCVLGWALHFIRKLSFFINIHAMATRLNKEERIAHISNMIKQ